MRLDDRLIVPSPESARPPRPFQAILVTAGLALAFFLAPALQGINLVADQSPVATEASRAADRAASSEVATLVTRP